ncbi:recombinase family protein [Kocuria rosea]|uniref:recombinase family protein n=1 Tax=Kocuria rosea TaxID=1275 RepID=UPI000689D39A|nr:recombinase family protein [Kocuria polaris]
MTPNLSPRTAIIYARVSTDEQGATGASLEAQVHELTAEARRRGWRTRVIRETASAKTMDRRRRPGLASALDMLTTDEAQVLMATRLDRISRNVSDFSQLIDRAKRQGWAIVLSKMDLDTTTSQGELMANIQMSFAQYERRLIGDRTRDGMAERARQGVHLGRARSLPLSVVEQVVALRQAGHTMKAIADGLNSAQVPTSTGAGEWTTSKIQSILKSKTAQQINEGAEVTVPAVLMDPLG